MLEAIAKVRKEEARAVAWAFVYGFALLSSFYVLRPLREEMGILGGVRNLPWLFTGTFVATLLAVPLFALIVARVPRRRVVPIAYHVFALCLVAFFALGLAGIAPRHVARTFFIWLSVYNVFVVSVFWSLMADLFTSEQGKRLFGLIAAGGSTGAICGPLVAGRLAEPLGPQSLLLVAAVLLEGCVLCVVQLVSWASQSGRSQLHGHEAERIGGGMLAGFVSVARSPYLLAIAAQVLLMTATATFVYLEQARIVAGAVADSAERTRLFADVDLVVNVASLALQGLAAGRVMAGLGLAFALALTPALGLVGFGALAIAPVLGVLLVVQVVRRGFHYGLERPSREVLYTAVGAEEKYKSKSFLDTVVYRGGDAASAWAHEGLVGRGAGTSAVALVGLPLAALSCVVAVVLARKHSVLVQGLEGERP